MAIWGSEKWGKSSPWLTNIWGGGVWGSGIFSGILTDQNLDFFFKEITSGNSHEISGITAADPGVITFAGGAELSSGTLDNDSYYVITATEVNHFYTGCAVTDRILGSDAIISQALDANNKVKLLHDYNTTDNSVISIGGVESEALGVDSVAGWDFTSGWLPAGSVVINDADTYTSTSNAGLYKSIVTPGKTYKLDITFTTAASGVQIINSQGSSAGTIIATANGTYFFTAGNDAGNAFIYFRNVGSGETTINSFVVKEVIPVLAKPYRIDSIDADGVCTLLNADFSDMAAAITSGYVASATLTNYTEGDGWMPGLDLDPTPVNSGTLTLGEVYYVTLLGTPDTFGVGVLLYDFFTSAGTETADATNTVVHITSTYAMCDGSQAAISELMSSEFAIVNGKGYKTTIISEIDAGGVTPLIGTKYGNQITSTGTDTQNIKGQITGDDAGVEAGTTFEGKITKLQIQSYE